MGFFSYNCLECGHPLLSSGATDQGINEWMTDCVVLTYCGSRILGEYDGYGCVGDSKSADGSACLHRACWEKAGKPEYDRYGKASSNAADQGWFFSDGAHDLIDPRIVEGREELLRVGVEARAKRRYDMKAREVYEALFDTEGFRQQGWECRFSYGPCYEEGERFVNGVYVAPKLLEGEWYMTDKYGTVDFSEHFKGSEDEVKAHLSGLWDAFVKSEECAALVARGKELEAEGLRAFHEQLKLKGRYEVSYAPSRKPVAKGRHATRYWVYDRMTYEHVLEVEYEGEGDNEKARRVKAEAEALRLNQEWAAQGFPYEMGES